MSTNAERQRKYRARQKGVVEPLSHSHIAHVPGHLTAHLVEGDDSDQTLCGKTTDRHGDEVTFMSRPCISCLGVAAFRTGATEAVLGFATRGSEIGVRTARIASSDDDPQAGADVTAPEFYTLDHAAQILDCSPDTIRRMISRGEIEAVRLGPRLIRIPADSIRAALRPVRRVSDD